MPSEDNSSEGIMSWSRKVDTREFIFSVSIFVSSSTNYYLKYIE